MCLSVCLSVCAGVSEAVWSSLQYHCLSLCFFLPCAWSPLRSCHIIPNTMSIVMQPLLRMLLLALTLDGMSAEVIQIVIMMRYQRCSAKWACSSTKMEKCMHKSHHEFLICSVICPYTMTKLWIDRNSKQNIILYQMRL